MLRRKSILALAAIILLSAFPLTLPRVNAENNVMYTVVNDKVFDFTPKYMPSYTDSVLYIPHIAIMDSDDLGVKVIWSDKHRYLTLAADTKRVTFEVGTNIAFDTERIYEGQSCKPYSDGNKTYFHLPVKFICDYFGLTGAELVNTDYGKMLRIKNPSARPLPEEIFLSAYNGEIKNKYETYVKSYIFVPPSPGQSNAPTQNNPTSPPTVSPTLEPVSVYLAFEGGPNENTGEILALLEQSGIRAAFFLQGSEISSYPAEMRQIAARHTIGLTAFDGRQSSFLSSSEEMLLQLNQGNAVMDAVCFRRTRLVRIPGGSSALTALQRDDLIFGGFRFWDGTISVRDNEKKSLSAMIKALDDGLADARKKSKPAVLMLGHTEKTIEILPVVINRIFSDGYYPLTIGTSGRPINEIGSLCAPTSER